MGDGEVVFGVVFGLAGRVEASVGRHDGGGSHGECNVKCGGKREKVRSRNGGRQMIIMTIKHFAPPKVRLHARSRLAESLSTTETNFTPLLPIRAVLVKNHLTP